jgi:hypothetical protein
MKALTPFCILVCLLLACVACNDDDSKSSGSRTNKMSATDKDAARRKDAGQEEPPATPPVKKPAKLDASAETDLDAGPADLDEDGGADAGLDAGGDATVSDAGVGVTLSDAATPGLRSLTINLSGFDDNLHRFMQFRVAPPDNSFQVMAVIHEGLPTATYRFELPNSLLAGVDYRLDFWVDTDQSGGYNPPPTDHAWSLPLPAGTSDIVIDFPHNTDFTEIESMAPIHDSSLILSASNMFMYAGQLVDVRAIEHGSGRLSGRQLREVPGDSFDVTVGSVIHGGLDYDVIVTVDGNDDGVVDLASDPSWHLTGTADDSGLHVPFSPDPAP